MKKWLCLCVSLVLLGVKANGTDEAVVHRLTSPNREIVLSVQSGDKLGYSLSFRGRELISRSALGFEFKGEKPMGANLEVVGETLEEGLVEAWTPVVKHRHANISLVYNRLTLKLREKLGERRRLDLTFNAYDEGVAFRYTLYGVSRPGDRQILEELTEFRVPETSFAWVGYNAHKGEDGSQESTFRKTSVVEIGANDWCLTPFLVEVDRANYLALMSAALDNYPGFYMAWRNGALVTRLAGSRTSRDVKARFDQRFDTPWRVILVGDAPGRFLESEIVRAVNRPCALADTSWIRPGISAWDHWWSGDVKMEMPVIKAYIDLAAEQGWPYMLIDWQWYGRFNRADANITKPAPQLDMPELIAYAKSRGVKFWLWLYASDVTRNDAFREAFPLYRQWGIAGVKIDFMDRYDREIVNWYRRIVACAAEHRLMVDFHGAYAPDGLERTYPNLMTREGVMGGEYSKFSDRITPEHNVNLAFTRGIVGSMDYTPGGFLNVSRTDFKPQRPTLVMNTRVAELAKFVIYESPLTVCSEHPRHLLGQPGADFLKVVPTVWDDVRFLGGYPGEYVALARRSGERWYVAVMGGNDARRVTIDLAQLGVAGSYRYWRDGEQPTDCRSGFAELSGPSLTVDLAPGGGFVAIFQLSQRVLTTDALSVLTSVSTSLKEDSSKK